MPFSVISRLRSAATRVTVSLRGMRFEGGSGGVGSGSGAGSGAGGSGCPHRPDGRCTSGS